MAAIQIGTRLGDRHVGERLGDGVLGPIHAASDPEHGAITVEVLEGAAPDAVRELVPRLRELNHPNLPQVLDSGEHLGTPYLVLEDAEGALPRWLWNVAVGRDSILGLLGGIAAALDCAHRAGLAHGEVVPDHVLLAADGRPLVTGTGLASLRGKVPAVLDDASLQRAAYRAPECSAGEAATPAGDRYALAVFAYHLLTGRPPFEGEAAEVADAQARDEPPPPSSLSATLGAETDRVLLRGLSRRPEARWRTGVQMIVALREAMRQDAAAAEGRMWPGWRQVLELAAVGAGIARRRLARWLPGALSGLAVPPPWWQVAAQGGTATLLAVVLLIEPGPDRLLALLALLGVHWMAGGILQLADVITGGSRWLWSAVTGILGIAAGLSVLREPMWSTLLVPAAQAPTLGVYGVLIGGIGLLRALAGGGRSAVLPALSSLAMGVLLLRVPAGTLVDAAEAWALVSGIGMLTATFVERSGLLARATRGRELAG